MLFRSPSTARVLSITNRLIHLTDWTAGEITPLGTTLLESLEGTGLGADLWLQCVGEVRAKDPVASMGNLGA